VVVRKDRFEELFMGVEDVASPGPGVEAKFVEFFAEGNEVDKIEVLLVPERQLIGILPKSTANCSDFRDSIEMRMLG
jgi:hypothetical protein